MKKNVNEIENTDSEAVREQKSSPAGVKVRKILSIALDVILYAFLILCVFVLIVSLTSKRNDGAANLFGYEMRIVVSPSMEKSEYSADVSQYKIKDIKTKSVVFVERVPEDEEKAKDWYAALKVGDVLTFRYVISSSQETITHRITEITPTETGYVIKLQGDNRTEGSTVDTQTIYTSSADYPNQNAIYNYVIGKVVGQSTFIGYILYAISQPVGLACIVIVPCAIIIIWQIVRVAAVIGEDRKKKAAVKIAEAERIAAAESEEREKQALELEELKRKLAQLERQNAGPEDGSHKDGESGAKAGEDGKTAQSAENGDGNV